MSFPEIAISQAETTVHVIKSSLYSRDFESSRLMVAAA
jgi:hypothetical protein